VSKVDEIAAAIEGLSGKEREELVARLPEILPEIDSDVKWEQIIRDPRPRPALSALGDEIEAGLRRNPCPHRSESKFFPHDVSNPLGRDLSVVIIAVEIGESAP
jgi:hypothetical protein